jgi:hypothetical protein
MLLYSCTNRNVDVSSLHFENAVSPAEPGTRAQLAHHEATFDIAAVLPNAADHCRRVTAGCKSVRSTQRLEKNDANCPLKGGGVQPVLEPNYATAMTKCSQMH